ncbi:(2Fe-2S)-binding protein [Nocardioides sp. LMS-CY]|uniref:(2Fe-2S)-binding protein n=1 Tax=Nocardioides sp. (strain LMS-CY) TaxID=2840457 RepID=UPI001C000949|nr:(2Fe-2S)-binding protein [Nocardioides sp. LMS-CY]QWF20040.1 (2Fe-2S)-binding protein [Nocardioides sp. LMS-CY]
MTDTVRLAVNGSDVELRVEPRETLADALRRTQGTRSVRLGCEHGACGACTVRLDGRTVRSCLVFAIQAEGAQVETAEGLAAHDACFQRLQESFACGNAFQCGFCATGMLMTASELLAEEPRPDADSVRERLAGNLCRCTGYESIVAGVLRAVDGATDPATGPATGEVAER